MMKQIKEHDFESYRYVIHLLQRGIDTHLIKNHPIPVLAAFAYFPLITLLKFHLSHIITMTDALIRDACNLAWDTLRK